MATLVKTCKIKYYSQRNSILWSVVMDRLDQASDLQSHQKLLSTKSRENCRLLGSVSLKSSTKLCKSLILEIVSTLSRTKTSNDFNTTSTCTSSRQSSNRNYRVKMISLVMISLFQKGSAVPLIALLLHNRASNTKRKIQIIPQVRKL